MNLTTSDVAIRLANALGPVEAAARAAVRVIDMDTPEYANLKDALAQLDREIARAQTGQDQL